MRGGTQVIVTLKADISIPCMPVLNGSMAAFIFAGKNAHENHSEG